MHSSEFFMKETAIAFYFAIYHEWLLATRLIKQIRKFYPNVPIITIADGTFDPDFAALGREYNIIFIQGERLKLLEHGGKWWERACTTFLELTTADTLIKIDPDTCIWRKFDFFPDADWFGSIERNMLYPFPRGGCKGIRRKAIERIIESKLLESPRFKHKFYAYDRFGRFKYPHENFPEIALVNEDLVLSEVAYQLKFSIANWTEVNIQFRHCPAIKNFAATHPHPYLEKSN